MQVEVLETSAADSVAVEESSAKISRRLSSGKIL